MLQDMKKDLAKRPLMVASMLAASLVTAQTDDASVPPGILLNPSEDGPLNRFGVNYRMAMNLSLDFKRLGGFRSQTDPGSVLGGGMNRFYDNGYNLVDSSGNAGGLTWNWGYDGSSPLNGGAGASSGDDIVLYSSSSPRRAHKNDVEDGPQHGMELTYERDIGRWGKGRWGLEGAFGFMNVSIDNDSRLLASVVQVVDSYDLGGVIPPLAPYEGTFEGPGPLVSDSPDRVTTVTPREAEVTGRRRFEADFYGLRLGPYYHFPLTEKLDVRGNIGLVMNVMKSTTSFNETVTIDGVGVQRTSARSTDTSFLVGGYVGAGFGYAINESWDLFAGAQYQYLGEYTDKANGKKAVADFGALVFVSLGVGYRF